MIQYFKPNINNFEIEAVRRILENGWFTHGKECIEFEKEFAEKEGCKYALSVNSCTSGLHLACEMVDKRSIVTTAYTYIATINAVYYAHKNIILLDTEKNDYNINRESCNEFLLNNTVGAYLLVNIAGKLNDEWLIDKIKETGRLVIEDCAHCYPIYRPRRGDIRVYSFYANKNITAGEGGMVCTDNEELYNKMKLLRDQGRNKNQIEMDGKEYDILIKGFKYNMNDISAAIGREQLKKMDDGWNKRKQIAKRYIDGLKVKTQEYDDNHSWHLFLIRFNTIKEREAAEDRLNKNEIGYSRHFKPVILFSRFKDIWLKEYFNNAINLYNHSLSLPIYPGLTKQKQDIIIRVINER